MLPQLMDETLKILGVDAGGIWLYNPERGKLCQMIGRGWCTQMAHLELDRGESLPGKVFATGDIYFSHDVAQDFADFTGYARSGSPGLERDMLANP